MHLVAYCVLADPRDWSLFPAGSPALPIELDRREFAGGRWWAAAAAAAVIESADPALLDPNMRRFLAKVRASSG